MTVWLLTMTLLSFDGLPLDQIVLKFATLEQCEAKRMYLEKKYTTDTVHAVGRCDTQQSEAPVTDP